MNLNKRETATILASLRYFQRLPGNVRRGSLLSAHFEDNFGSVMKQLTDEQIDSLCERINIDHEPTTHGVSDAITKGIR